MALSVPLSRSTLRVGGGSAFFVRHQDRFKIFRAGWFGEDLSSLIQMSKLSAVSRIQLAPVYAASKCGAAGCVSVGICLIYYEFHVFDA
jgi:hypothetical protein